MLSKTALRRSLLNQRQNLSPDQLKRCNTDIVHALRQDDWFQSAKTIFAYRSFRQEVSLQSLYETTLSTHRWGFPRCQDQPGDKTMVWHQWQGQGAEEFAMGSYGIEEPQTFWPELREPDLILVPTVACDRRGFRLGYGGGYYDRMLANLSPKTRTIGIGLDQFLLDQLPIDDWDIPLDAICTESGLFYIAATQ